MMLLPRVWHYLNKNGLGIPLRKFGNSDERVSVIGYGGWDSVVNKTDEESTNLMREVFDRIMKSFFMIIHGDLKMAGLRR